MKHIQLYEEFINEDQLKAGRDENTAKAILAYFYAVEGTPEGNIVRDMGQHPIRSDVNPKNNEMIQFSGWTKDGIKAIAGVSRVPSSVMLGNVIDLAANNGKSYYFDGTDFVEGDKTIIKNTHKIGFRDFVDTLVKMGIIEKPKY